MTGFTATDLPIPSRGVIHQVCDLGYLQRAVTGAMLTSVTVLPSPELPVRCAPDSTSDGSLRAPQALRWHHPEPRTSSGRYAAPSRAGWRDSLTPLPEAPRATRVAIVNASLDGHVAPHLECLDRIYLNGGWPPCRSPGGGQLPETGLQTRRPILLHRTASG